MRDPFFEAEEYLAEISYEPPFDALDPEYESLCDEARDEDNFEGPDDPASFLNEDIPF